MSYKLKGSPGPTQSARMVEYDQQTGDYSESADWEGSQQAIDSLVNALSRTLTSYRTQIRDGHGVATIRSPLFKIAAQPAIRYEVFTELVQKEIWEHPLIIAASDAYDALADVTGDDPSFQTLCEEYQDQKTYTFPAAIADIGNKVVSMLKNGITGWDAEYITVRRIRRVPNIGLKSPPTHIATVGQDSGFIYSTAQLGLDPAIAFIVPDSSTLSSSHGSGRTSYSMWGWRRRPTQVIYESDWIEQSGEFELAEWSTTLYEAATGDAEW